jgi:dolichyl-phosphate-mannose--protein O-mannosyl transferase
MNRAKVFVKFFFFVLFMAIYFAMVIVIFCALGFHFKRSLKTVTRLNSIYSHVFVKLIGLKINLRYTRTLATEDQQHSQKPAQPRRQRLQDSYLIVCNHL